MKEPSHRERTVSYLRQMYELSDTHGRRDEAAVLKDALHYLGADALLEKASAIRRTADPTADALIEAMLPQLLLVMLQRLGGEVRVPVDEIDATGGLVMSMAVEADGFSHALRFVVRRKDR